MRRFGAALDGSDTGTGKTYSAIAVARELGVTPLVIAPKPTLPSWDRAGEFLGHPGETINYEMIRGRAESRESGKLAVSEYGREVARGSGSGWVWSQPYELVIFDEVDRCAGSTSLNSKMLIAAKRQCKRVLCLSATAADSPLQMKALGFALGLHDIKTFWNWILRYGCKPAVFGGFEFTKDRKKAAAAMLKLHSLIYPARGARLRKAEIPGFPKTQIATKILPISDGKVEALAAEVAELYRHRKKQEAESEENPMVESIRARQALELLMAPDAAELAKDYALSSKVILFVNFRDTVTVLRKLLPGAVILAGDDIEPGYGPTQRQQAMDIFQRNAAPYIICTYGAGGVGVNLHDPTGAETRTNLLFPCYSARMLVQATGRPNREGAAFSDQFLLYFNCKTHKRIALTLDTKLDSLAALNDGILNGAV